VQATCGDRFKIDHWNIHHSTNGITSLQGRCDDANSKWMAVCGVTGPHTWSGKTYSEVHLPSYHTDKIMSFAGSGVSTGTNTWLTCPKGYWITGYSCTYSGDHVYSLKLECRQPYHIHCDWNCYLDRYDDVSFAFGWNNTKQAKIHFLASGMKEGRDCTCPEKTPSPIGDVMAIADLTDEPTVVPTATPTHNPGRQRCMCSRMCARLCLCMSMLRPRFDGPPYEKSGVQYLIRGRHLHLLRAHPNSRLIVRQHFRRNHNSYHKANEQSRAHLRS
jgi:hypothetical protein